MFKNAWSCTTSDHSSEGKGPIDMPHGLKKYTISDRNIIQQKPMHQKPKTLRVFSMDQKMLNK